MSQDHNEEKIDIRQFISDAYERGETAAMTLTDGNRARVVKTVILTLGTDGFWLEASAQDGYLIDSLVESSQPVRIVVAGGHGRIAFNTPALSHYHGNHLIPGKMLDAVQFAWPERFEVLQTRNSYRVRLTAFSGVQISIWRIEEYDRLIDLPLEIHRLPIEVRDISGGGMGVVVRGSPFLADKLVIENDRLRILVEYKEHKLLLEGRIRYPAQASRDHDVPAGIQFQTGHANSVDRHAFNELTKIVSELQREELRRIRRAG